MEIDAPDKGARIHPVGSKNGLIWLHASRVKSSVNAEGFAGFVKSPFKEVMFFVARGLLDRS